MKRTSVLAVVFALGLILTILGISWNRVVPSSAYWSDAKADEFSKAQSDLHAQLHQTAPDQEAKYRAARDRFIKIRDELENARDSRSWMKTAVTAVGITLLLIGILYHFSKR